MKNQTVNLVEETVLRLHSERKQIAERSFSEGVHDGMNWGSHASYEELREWIRNAGGCLDEQCMDWDNFILPDDVVEILDDAEKDGYCFERDSYAEGWCIGLMNFWGAVANKI